MSGINRTGSKKAANSVANQSTSASKNDAKVMASPTVSDDQLQLSAEAQQLEELFQSLSGVEEIDKKRVESIRQAIKKGELPVDYQMLANKILELTDELNDHK